MSLEVQGHTLPYLKVSCVVKWRQEGLGVTAFLFCATPSLLHIEPTVQIFIGPSVYLDVFVPLGLLENIFILPLH